MAVITESFPAYLARVKRIGQATCGVFCCWDSPPMCAAADRAEDEVRARWIAREEVTETKRRARR